MKIECAHCEFSVSLNACDRDMATRLLSAHKCEPKQLAWIENGKLKRAEGAGLVSAARLPEAEITLGLREMVRMAQSIAQEGPPAPSMRIYLDRLDN